MRTPIEKQKAALYRTFTVQITWARTRDERGTRFLLVGAVELVEEDEEAQTLGH